MKKGNIEDIGASIFIFMGIFIALFVMFTVVDNFTTKIQANPSANYTQVNEDAATFKGRYLKAWDVGVFIMAIMFIVFSYIAASKIPVDIKVSIIAFLVIGFVILLSLAISNFYGGMIENGYVSTMTDQMVFVPLILPRLPIYAMIYAFVVLVGLYGKKEYS